MEQTLQELAYRTQEEQDYLNSNISKCVIEKGHMSEIAFIYKR